MPVTTIGLSVVPGQTTNYRCNDSSLVFNTTKYVALTCANNGSILLPTSWPPCRVPANCTAPKPPTPTKLVLSASSPALLKEFDSAIYVCKTGFTLAGITPDGLTYSPVCPYGGGAFSIATWPYCNVTMATTTGRKKRYIDYKTIFGDIQYSVFALFETQFMYTK